MTTTQVSRVAVTRPEPTRLLRQGAYGLAAGCWVYAAVMAVAVKFLASRPAAMNWLTDYLGVPVTLAALALIGMLLFRARSLGPVERRAWWVTGAFAIVNLLANEVWVRVPGAGSRAVVSYEDLLYLADYGVLTVAFGLFFVALGGSWRQSRVWLDVGSLMLVQLIGIWTLLVAPVVPAGVDRYASVAVIVGYSVSFALMTSAATVLWMQTRSRPGQGAMMLLIAAAWCEVAWEVVWLASWLTDSNYAAYYYNFGDLLCFCCVATAAAITLARPVSRESASHPERSAESFLPAFASLLAIAMVSASMGSTRGSEAWSLVGLVVLCASLVLIRQRSVQRELRAMSASLARQQAEARLTELVRSSADLIVVIDATGAAGFVSPASSAMLGIEPPDLHGAPGAQLLGPAHRARLQGFIDQLRAAEGAVAPIELSHVKPDGAERILRVSGVDRLGNPLIGGLVLTLTDVTEQRALEREVLEVATRERARFCGDIHDGLCQELVGVAMLLQGEATMPDADPTVHQSHLKALVGHVNRSIQMARDLARGLSPLHVVRGSLCGALRRMAHECSARRPVSLSIAAGVDDQAVDDVAADHLYRIAQEAVLNAITHAECTRIELSLARMDSRLVLEIRDDGRGFDAGVAREQRGLGLKLMEYRARQVGGEFRCDSAPHSGTRVQVTLAGRAELPPATLRAATRVGRQAAGGGR